MNNDRRQGGREHVQRQKTMGPRRFSEERVAEYERKLAESNEEGEENSRERGRFGRSRNDFNDERPNGRRFGDRKFGDRKFGDRKFGDKPFGGRRFDDRDDDKRGSFDKKPRRRFDDDKKDFRYDRREGKFGHHDYDDDERPTRSRFGGRNRDFGRKFDDNRSFSDDRGERSFGKRFGGRDKKFGGSRLPRREGGFRRREKDPDFDRPRATGEIRLNKYLADSGICSRREADDLILAGAVTVNGVVVTELGTKVKTGDKVIYGGETLNREKLRYVLLNKPKGVITTSDDPYERHTVMELVEGACEERIYPVGRLDRNTLGLLLLTNDGDLAKILTHPSHEVEKLYHVVLNKPLTNNDFEKIQQGLTLEDGPIQVDEIAYVTEDPTMCEVGVKIHSGRNHIVRRIFESLGYEVLKLDRVMLAGLTKQNLPRGHWRFLTPAEISMLKNIK